jgi:hypothetical protein
MSQWPLVWGLQWWSYISIPPYIFMAWCLIKPRLIHLFRVRRFGPAVLAPGEGQLGDSLSDEGAPPCGQGDIPGASVQLPGTSDRLEVLYVPHLCVSTAVSRGCTMYLSEPLGFTDPYVCVCNVTVRWQLWNYLFLSYHNNELSSV